MAININLSTSAFLIELMNLATDIVWKNQALANEYETSDNQIDEEIFVSAKKGILTFDTIFQLDEYTLTQLGYTQDQMAAAMDDKYFVSTSLRDSALNIYVNHLIDYDTNTGHYINYNEPNNYYRMLNGLPDIDDTDFIYQTDYADIDQQTPIHLLPLVDRYTMENDGYLDTLLKKYPTKKYINYLATKQVDPYKARIADRYAILWMNSSEYTTLYNDFREMYAKARNNIIRVYYNTAYSKANSSYEGFMAMCVLFMTLSLMHYKYLSADITRDFYDLESIRYIYDSYGVPFYSNIPLDSHKEIIKNINKLLEYKGSTRVFYDLFSLFGYNDIDVYEYYLLKSRKFDENGRPIFSYNEDGSPIYEDMYEIKFGKVRLYDDPPMSLSDTTNHVSYAQLVSADPYWVSDDDLMTAIYEEDFNYLESKYLGIQTVFDMYKILFESSYFFKMLLDNRTALTATTLTFNNINGTANLFDLTIYLCALTSRKYGYSGNIPTDIASVAKVLGYNFATSLTTIRTAIMNNKYLKNDAVLASIFTSMNVNSIANANATYEKFITLRDHIVEALSSTKNRDEWQAYYELYNSVLTSKVLQSTYTKSDGSVASTFEDLLSDINISLYIREISEDLDVDTEIDDVLTLYNKSFTNLEYVEYADGIDISSMIEQLFTILEFFKSAKSELVGYNIVYTISQRGVNFFKMLDTIKFVSYLDNAESQITYLSDKLKKFIGKEKLASDTGVLSDLLRNYGVDQNVIDSTFESFSDIFKPVSESIHMDKYNNSQLSLNDIIHRDELECNIKENKLLNDTLVVLYERTVE